MRAGRVRRSGSRPTWRSASRATGCGPGTWSSRATRSTARSRGPRSWRRRRTSTRPTPGSRRRRGSGVAGSGGPGSRTTAGAIRSSARRWRSRASPTCPPGRRWRRSRPPCRRRRAASATGTTASPGCATRPSRSRRCTSSTSTGRRTSSCSSSPTSRPNEDGALQIMYGIDGRRDLTESTRDDLSGYAGARPVRIGNGAFDQRQNDVFGAVLDSVLLHTRRSERLPRRLWPIVADPGGMRDRTCGASPTRGSGRRAASRSTTCPRSSCAGSRWTARPSSPTTAATPELNETWRATAEEIKAGHPRARPQGRRAATALRDRGAGRLDAAGGALRLPACRTTSACTRACSRSPTT